MQAMQGFRVCTQQSHLWELAQDDSQHCCQCALLIEGELDQQLLRELIARIIARHEILRTGFYRQPGLKVPLQIINEAGTYSWKELDLRAETPHRAEERLECELLKQGQSGNTQSGSPLNVLLACLGQGKHLLSLALPSMFCDTLSFVNLSAEIASGLTKAGRGA